MNETISICIIEDHQFIIDGIKRMLKSEIQFKVVQEFTDPLLALEAISNKKKLMDLIICDISMPMISGIDLMRKFKELNPEQKLLALTMHEETQYAKELYFIGVEGYLLKNSPKKKFIEAIQRIVEGKPAYDSNVLKRILSEVKDRKNQRDLSVLTEREIDVLKLIIQEKTSKEIAEQLNISKQTVDTHRKRIMQKTEVKGIIGLVKFAYANDLIVPKN